jgi:putative DNA primase/helicase
LEFSEIKSLINTYYKAGQPKDVTAEIITKLNVNGLVEAANEYIHKLYANENWAFGRNLSDTGNAERLVTMYGDRLRYCYARKKFMIYNGDYWLWDDGDQVMTMAKEVVKSIYKEASTEPDDDRREDIAKFAHVSESESKRRAMLDLVQSENGVPVEISAVDANHWVFNCLNGTIDLKTGKLKDHQKEDLLSIIIPINYDPEAKCDLWLNFLNRVTGGKPELISYLQRAIGYSLTGEISEQCLFFLYGLGKNGKSTFVSILRKLMGPYGHKTTTDTFLTKDRGGGVKEDLANLQGKRFVVASELEDGKRLAVVLIKEMTGGETISADRKYEHQFEFTPTHKIWLSGNHKPVITDTTYSIWRRFKLIPFTVTIPQKEQDPHLSKKLEKELPGILAWAVKGCLDWQKEGLGEPDQVVDATEAYRIEQDVLGEFMEDECLLGNIAVVAKSEILKAYTDWCAKNNQLPINQRAFRGKLIERGIIEHRGTGGTRQWRGITLKTTPQEQQELVTVSDSSDKKAAILPGNTATFSRVETSQQNDVSNVTTVTNEIPDSICPVCGNDDWRFNELCQAICANNHIQRRIKTA